MCVVLCGFCQVYLEHRHRKQTSFNILTVNKQALKKLWTNKLGLDVETSKPLVLRFASLVEIRFAPFVEDGEGMRHETLPYAIRRVLREGGHLIEQRRQDRFACGRRQGLDQSQRHFSRIRLDGLQGSDEAGQETCRVVIPFVQRQPGKFLGGGGRLALVHRTRFARPQDPLRLSPGPASLVAVETVSAYVGHARRDNGWLEMTPLL